MLTTDKLIILALVQKKYIKDKLHEINRGITKFANTAKIYLAIVFLFFFIFL